MLDKARQQNLYDALDAADLLDHLRRFAAAFDLIVAADALVYCGDLEPVFAATAAALAPGGLFVFTVETHAGDGFRLGATMRFAHARAYVEATAAAAGLTLRLVEDASSRREAGAAVAGLVCVFLI